MIWKIPINQFGNWLRSKKLAETTIQEYLYYFGMFWPHERYDQENVSDFLGKKGNQNPVARAFLKNFQRFLMTNYKGLGLSNDDRIDIAEVDIPKTTGRPPEKIVKPLTEEQIWELEKFLPEEKEKLMLLTSYYGGLRVGEMFRIKISSFNWDDFKKNPEEMGECRVYGKGAKEGIALFPSWLMKRIAKFIRSSNFASPSSCLFLRKIENLENVKIQNRIGTWDRKLKKAGEKAGIIKYDSDGKIDPDTNIHSHKLRHSWGYHLKNVKKLDIRDIQEILRHADIQSTQRYTLVEKGRLKELLK